MEYFYTVEIDAELTWCATAGILRERCITTVVLPPATIRAGADIVVGRGPDTDTGVAGIGLGAAMMLVHDAM